MKGLVYLTLAVFTFGAALPNASASTSHPGPSEQLRVDLDTSFEQDLNAYKPNVPKTTKQSNSIGASSVSFLMGDALSKPSVPTKEDIAKIDFDRFTVKKVSEKKSAPKVAEAVSNDCSEQNGRNGHITSCVNRYSDGSYTETIDQDFGDKRQVIITDYDKNDERVSRKSIRYRKTHTPEGVLTAEHIDVVTRPYTGKILREFLVRHVDPVTDKTTKLMWTKYKQIENEMLAEISHHAVLNFDHRGEIKDGRAEKWDGNKVIDTLLNVDKIRFPAMRVERTTWNQWESRIHNMIQQVRVL